MTFTITIFAVLDLAFGILLGYWLWGSAAAEKKKRRLITQALNKAEDLLRQRNELEDKLAASRQDHMATCKKLEDCCAEKIKMLNEHMKAINKHISSLDVYDELVRQANNERDQYRKLLEVPRQPQ